MALFFFSSRRRHTRLQGDWSSDVCSSDLAVARDQGRKAEAISRPSLLGGGWLACACWRLAKPVEPGDENDDHHRRRVTTQSCKSGGVFFSIFAGVRGVFSFFFSRRTDCPRRGFAN